MLALLLALLIAPAAAQERDMHVVPLPQAQWPGNVPVDIPATRCDSVPGAKVSPGRNTNLCYITTTLCEQNPGWHVVMRDAYMAGSSRIPACRHTG
jgi:hypothetical protein